MQGDKAVHKKAKRNSSRFLHFTRNYSIGAKYLFALSISIILFLLATAITFYQFTTAKNDVDDIIDKSQLANDLAQLALYVEQQDSLISNYIIIGNPQYVDEYNELREQLTAVIDRLEPQITDEIHKSLYERVVQNNETINDLFVNQVLDENTDDSKIVTAQIQIGSQKSSIVTLLNRLIDDVNIERNDSVTNVNESMETTTYVLLIINVASIITGLIIMIVISRIISRNLKKIVAITNEMSTGNLAVERMEYDGKDEIGQLANAINTLSDNMRNVIHKVTEASQSVSTSSKGLTSSAREVKVGSEQMVVTMEELATGAETQANSAADLSERMVSFVEYVQDFQQEGLQIAVSSKEVQTLTNDGTNLMKQSITQMDKIDQIVTDAVSKVRGLDEKSEEITSLVEVVRDIADQTNLLALNAAIEAARAGEHGLGFAVVAEEVRKLAEQVTSSVTEITYIVNNIHDETNAVVTSLNEGYEEVKEGISQIERTGESFRMIDHSVSGMVMSISDIVEKLQQFAENSDRMNHLIEDIAAVSEEAAAGVEESVASTEETSSSMDEILRNAEELSSLAEQLKNEILTFRL